VKWETKINIYESSGPFTNLADAYLLIEAVAPTAQRENFCFWRDLMGSDVGCSVPRVELSEFRGFQRTFPTRKQRRSIQKKKFCKKMRNK